MLKMMIILFRLEVNISLMSQINNHLRNYRLDQKDNTNLKSSLLILKDNKLTNMMSNLLNPRVNMQINMMKNLLRKDLIQTLMTSNLLEEETRDKNIINLMSNLLEVKVLTQIPMMNSQFNLKEDIRINMKINH